MNKYTIHGFVEYGYDPVRHLFATNFENGIEDNAQLCVFVKGEMVINLWGTTNIAPKGRRRTGRVIAPYDDETLCCVYSCSKVLSAICMALLVDKQLLSYDDPVVMHWPEYGDGDVEKEMITIADILRHQGGMHKTNKTITLADIQKEHIKKNSIGGVIAKQKLRFPPEEAATKTQYHMYTIGFILNEICRRVDPRERTIGECLREDISYKLNAAAYIGLQFEELGKSSPMSYLTFCQVFWGSLKPKCMGRKVQCSFSDCVQRIKEVLKVKNSKSKKPSALENVNSFRTFLTTVVKTGEAPGANAQASAKGLATIAAMVANKGELNGTVCFSEATWKLLHSDFQTKPMFPHYGTSNFSQGGVNLFDSVDSKKSFFKANDYRKEFVGWLGFGGSVIQWHPELQIGFGYVPTLISWEDPANTKAAVLQQTVVQCVRRIKEKEVALTANSNFAFISD